MRRDDLGTEYRGAVLGDKRRSDRLERLASQMAKRPEASFPEVLDEGQLEGAYRFLTNEAVTVDAMLAPHVSQTVERIGKRAALAVHDTTVLSFRVDGKRQGFNQGVSKNRTQQFWTHTTLAVAADGSREPYGVLHTSHATTIEHRRWREHVAHVAPLGLDLIHVMDREADDFALLHALVEQGERFVIRLQFDRNITPPRSREPRCLTDVLQTALLEGAPSIRRDVLLNARPEQDSEQRRKTHPTRQARVASLAMAGIRVRLPPSRERAKSLSAVELTFVHVWEPEPPPGEAAIEWKLITTEPADLESIEQTVDWYRARWTIEELFKALKTGCAVEKRQLETFYALTRAVTFFMPMAWHMLFLRHQARHAPDTPAEQVISPSQLAALRAISRRPLPLSPTARDILLAIAALGGHLRRNGEPGWITLHRGYETLLLVAMGWKARSDQS
jgi:hypothetical protein